MKQLIFLLSTFILSLTSATFVSGQSHKTKKLYEHYQTLTDAQVSSVSKDMVGIAVAFVKDNQSIKKILTDVTSIKTITTRNPEYVDDIANQLPGKKYDIEVKGLKKPINIWVKRRLWRVREANLIYNSGRQTMVISVFGNFKVRDIKEFNEKFIKNGGLSKIPMLSNY
jgi:hypothetical protein